LQAQRHAKACNPFRKTGQKLPRNGASILYQNVLKNVLKLSPDPS